MLKISEILTRSRNSSQLIHLLLIFFAVMYVQFDLHAQRKKQPMDSSAYLEQPNRIEFIFEDNDVGFTVINAEEDGLMVVKETTVKNQDGLGWVLYKLDTALQLEWTKLLLVPVGHSFRGWDYSSGHFYLMFSTQQYGQDEFSIYRVDKEKGSISDYTFSTVFPIFLTHFEVIDETILVAGRVNFKPAVLTFELEELKPRVIPGIYNGNSELLEIFVDDKLNVFSVAMIERLFDRRFSVNVKTYNTSNQEIQNHRVMPVGRTSIIDGAPTQFSGGIQYIAGAYSLRSPEYSRGLYLSRFANGQQSFIKYYNYADLSNFFTYMGNRREQRVQDRIEKRKEKGKKNRFNYRLLIHDIIQRDDQFLLIGEAYYPRYSNYANYSAGISSGSFVGSRAAILGYKFTHAIVVAFDRNGEILWDQSFPIEDVFKEQLTETVQVIAKKDRVELHYLEENTIRSKVIIGDEVFEGNSFTPVKLKSDKDENVLKDPDVEGLQHWYGSTLYAYGEQQLEYRVSERVKTKREIFYVNKVYYNLNDTTQ